MRAGSFQAVSGNLENGIRLVFRQFPVSAPTTFWLHSTPAGLQLVRAYGSTPAGRLKTCAAIAAAIRDGYIERAS